MGAHAVGATVGWPVIAIAKLFGRDVVDLRKRRRRRKCERDFIDERDYVISGRCDCGEGEMTRMIYKFRFERVSITFQLVCLRI